MFKLIPFAIAQSLLLSLGQVFLKYGLGRMAPFGWNWTFWKSALLNWQFVCSGITFGSASLLWMWIVKNFPLSQSTPMVSLSYVFSMIAAILFFHEEVDATKWIGVFLIIVGCFFIAK